MAHKKAGGTAKNLRDSKPKFLGVKLFDGQIAKEGSIILRQRGTQMLPGQNVKIGRDHTIFAIKEGKVKFTRKRKLNFDGKTKYLPVVNVV
ncbi:MAG TPA: 50S ribosomal protein L27 [Candidatus Paceibacterota bacterium]